MHALAALAEELESRPADADRVDALARHLRAVGRHAGALAADWLVAGAREPRPARPARLTQAALTDAARELAAAQGTAPWLFDAGRAAAAEAADAIALLLPWPDAGAAHAAPARPSLADWLADWAAAAAQPAATRASAVAACIARLDDAPARRWAVRAACGLARPVVDAWQWQRAWARAFDADPLAVAWWWQHGRAALLHDEPPPDLPRPQEFAGLPEAAEAAHPALLAGWQAGEWFAQPRCSGVRVQVARRGAAVAVWQRGGRLLNDRLPAAWLDAAGWPDGAVIEAVLVARRAGRPVALAQVAAPTRAGAAADELAPATLHLALTDWHGLDEPPAARRARLLARWPAPADPAAPPPIFTLPPLHLPGHGSLADAAGAARAAGASGLVLRHASADAAWAVRAPARRIHAVLQYVPGEVLAAGGAAALAFVDCGFALWNRAPRAPAEQQAALAAAAAGEFVPPPDDAPGVDGLRLLPLARLPIALPEPELQRLHEWLRANAGRRFGGMHAVAPLQVFEIAYDQARPSRRHRLGATLAGARVLRWLPQAPPGAAQLAAELDLS